MRAPERLRLVLGGVLGPLGAACVVPPGDRSGVVVLDSESLLTSRVVRMEELPVLRRLSAVPALPTTVLGAVSTLALRRKVELDIVSKGIVFVQLMVDDELGVLGRLAKLMQIYPGLPSSSTSLFLFTSRLIWIWIIRFPIYRIIDLLLSLSVSVVFFLLLFRICSKHEITHALYSLYES